MRVPDFGQCAAHHSNHSYLSAHHSNHSKHTYHEITDDDETDSNSFDSNSEEAPLLIDADSLSTKATKREPDERKSTKNTIIGMFCVAAGTGFIGAGGCIVAIIGGSILEIMIVRYCIGMVLSTSLWILNKPSQSTCWYGEASDRFNVWIRGFLFFVQIFGWYRGLELVPIGDAEAIIFLAPIMIVFIARFVLKEPLSKLFPLTFLLTITGIVFVCQPEFIFNGAGGSRNISIVGLIFLLFMAISWAITSILVRTATNAHWIQMQIVCTVQGSFIWTPLLIVLDTFVVKSDFIGGGKWTSDAETIGFMILCALFGYLGLSLNVIGYQMGDATKVAWMEYFDLIFAYFFQYTIFGNAPNIWEWIGLVCLLSTCAVHLVEEIIKYKNAMSTIV